MARTFCLNTTQLVGPTALSWLSQLWDFFAELRLQTGGLSNGDLILFWTYHIHSTFNNLLPLCAPVDRAQIQQRTGPLEVGGSSLGFIVKLCLRFAWRWSGVSGLIPPEAIEHRVCKMTVFAIYRHTSRFTLLPRFLVYVSHNSSCVAVC